MKHAGLTISSTAPPSIIEPLPRPDSDNPQRRSPAVTAYGGSSIPIPPLGPPTPTRPKNMQISDQNKNIRTTTHPPHQPTNPPIHPSIHPTKLLAQARTSTGWEHQESPPCVARMTYVPAAVSLGMVMGTATAACCFFWGGGGGMFVFGRVYASFLRSFPI